MRFQRIVTDITLVLTLVVMNICLSACVQAQTDVRQTPLVRAIKGCSESVVNLRGRKTVRSTDSVGDTVKQVNGMGTGVVIDPRGYVLTNYHVVEGVKNIEVTTSDGTRTTAKLVAHDNATDLAVLKISVGRPLPVIRIGTSSDLMLAETVAAVGNAYGYEHTVTVGIISQLGRTVQVNDQQVYENLIQTDAPINPGNSGGPLLNLKGEMIGINVAVRIGAQGIAFAIPVNDAMTVAAKLMKQIIDRQVYHGLEAKTRFVNNQPVVIVNHVSPGSPADEAGIRTGDQLLGLNQVSLKNELDLHRSLLGKRIREEVNFKVRSGKSVREVALRLNKRELPKRDVAWEQLGIRVIPASDAEMRGRHPNYNRGLRITGIKPGSPADLEGILEGDVLVAMHGWKTESVANLLYILEQPDIQQSKDFMFFILRDKEPFWGKMRVATRLRP